jgi:histidinol dehydrogenase
VAGGSEADLLEISQQLDGIKPKSIRVEKGELEKALATLPNDIKKSLNLAIQQVSKYHKTQLPIDTKNQVIAGGEIDRRWVAVDRVGAT